ncbi:hypothetical protein ACOME3_001191 [Neoechinorhynchus agilis]
MSLHLSHLLILHLRRKSYLSPSCSLLNLHRSKAANHIEVKPTVSLKPASPIGTRGRLFDELTDQIKYAIVDSKGDTANNDRLKWLTEFANDRNVPKSVVDSAVRTFSLITQTKTLYHFEMMGPNRCNIGVDIYGLRVKQMAFTMNMNIRKFLIDMVRPVTDTTNSVFASRGMILVPFHLLKSSMDTATEVAIDVGADDIEELTTDEPIGLDHANIGSSNKRVYMKFMCDPESRLSIEAKLRKDHGLITVMSRDEKIPNRWVRLASKTDHEILEKIQLRIAELYINAVCDFYSNAVPFEESIE